LDSLRKRPTRSPADRKKDEQIIFPKTLPSGRLEQQNTVAQKLYKPPKSADESADRRFFQKLTDYREIQDPDPYATLFGESKQTEKIRIREWQKQFEEENKDVWLPYERTSRISRMAPNWFVRYFVELRNKGGIKSLHSFFFGLAVIAALLLFASYLSGRRPSDQCAPIEELR
jgi:hypothetical protein